MKIRKIFWMTVFALNIMLFCQTMTAEAADVYRVDRYGELYDYSGNPVVTIRSNTSAIRDDTFRGVRTTRFKVSSGNPYFKAVNGALYSKDGTILFRCPTEKTGTFNILSSVKKIEDGAFTDCTKLTKVTMPNSVTVMGEHCFEDCSSLKNVTISNKLKKISSESFCDCNNLRNITIPISVKEIGERAFYNCQSLQSLSLPDSVVSIGSDSFGACLGLKSVRLSGKMDTISDGAFSECTNLKTVKNTNKIEEIASYAFYNCISLKSISFSDNLDQIGNSAFKFCESLGTVSIPRKTQYIAKNAFTGAAKRFVVEASNPNYASSNGMLMDETKQKLIQAPAKMNGDLKIPKGTTKIADDALVYGDYSSITIPEKVTVIEKDQFENCKNLKELYLPASIAEIRGSYYNASQLGVENLRRIVIAKGNTQYQSVDGVVYSIDGKTMVFYPYGKKGSLTLPDTCKYIGKQMKENKLSSIHVTANNKYYTSMNGVLYNLRGTKIKCFPMRKKTYKLPKTLRSIEYLNSIKEDLKCEAIQVDSRNKKFYSKGGVVFEEDTDTLLFYPTKKKGNYKVPLSTKYIAGRAFSEAHNLTGITITKNVKRQSGTTYRFYQCPKLKKILVKQGKLNYVSMDFYKCNKLKKITFPSNIMRTDLSDLPKGVTIHGWKNTYAKEAAEGAKGKFVSRGTIPNVVTGIRIKKIIDKYQICWSASSEASGYQVYTVYDTIKNLSGSGNTSCYVEDIYEYDTIYIRAYKIVKGKKVYGKARAVNID